METVIVTGGAGFIGSNLVRELLNRRYRVVCVDNFDNTYNPAFKEENVSEFDGKENFVLERVDVRNFEELKNIFEKEKPGYVVHLAAKVDTRDAVKNPREYISVNIDGTLNILELAREYGIKNLVLASSSSVYGNTGSAPWSEEEKADRQLSPYGATKRSKELLAYAYHHNFKMNITCLRYFNAYGEGNRPTMVPYLWTEALLTGKEIEMSGDGSRKRDYTYIEDVVSATVSAMEKPLGYEIINIGDNRPVSLREFLSVLEKATGVSAKVKTRPSHHASVEATYANIEKAKKLLDWEPKVPIEVGISRLVSWFKDNRLKNTV